MIRSFNRHINSDSISGTPEGQTVYHSSRLNLINARISRNLYSIYFADVTPFRPDRRGYNFYSSKLYNKNQYIHYYYGDTCKDTCALRGILGGSLRESGGSPANKVENLSTISGHRKTWLKTSNTFSAHRKTWLETSNTFSAHRKTCLETSTILSAHRKINLTLKADHRVA